VQQQPEQGGGVGGTECRDAKSAGKRGRGRGRPALQRQQDQQVHEPVVDDQPVRGGKQSRGARTVSRRVAGSR
jgi:hypothetical protein